MGAGNHLPADHKWDLLCHPSSEQIAHAQWQVPRRALTLCCGRGEAQALPEVPVTPRSFHKRLCLLGCPDGHESR